MVLVGVVESGIVAAGGIELLLSFCTRTAGGIAAGKDNLIGIRVAGMGINDSRSNEFKREALGFVVSAIRNLVRFSGAFLFRIFSNKNSCLSGHERGCTNSAAQWRCYCTSDP